MKLDLSNPTFVVVGSFNDAIFTPNWAGEHLFGKAPGTDITIVQTVALNPTQRSRFYIDDIGIFATRSRLEVTPNNFSPATISLAETVLTNVFRTLPHTPITALGINFLFVVDQLGDEVLDKLKSRDGFDEMFADFKQDRLLTSVAYAPGVELNFNRGTVGASATFQFNFHYTPFTPQMVEGIPGSVNRLIEASQKVMQKLYNLHDFEVNRLQFENPAQIEGAT